MNNPITVVQAPAITFDTAAYEAAYAAYAAALRDGMADQARVSAVSVCVACFVIYMMAWQQDTVKWLPRLLWTRIRKHGMGSTNGFLLLCMNRNLTHTFGWSTSTCARQLPWLKQKQLVTFHDLLCVLAVFEDWLNVHFPVN